METDWTIIITIIGVGAVIWGSNWNSNRALRRDMDRRFDQAEKHTDERFDKFEKHTDERFAEVHRRLDGLANDHGRLTQRVDDVQREVTAVWKEVSVTRAEVAEFRGDFNARLDGRTLPKPEPNPEPEPEPPGESA